MLPKMILRGTVDSRPRRGSPRKSRMYNIKEWAGQSMSSFMHIADDRSRWAVITAEASVGVLQQRLGVTGIYLEVQPRLLMLDSQRKSEKYRSLEQSYHLLSIWDENSNNLLQDYVISYNFYVAGVEVHSFKSRWKIAYLQYVTVIKNTV